MKNYNSLLPIWNASERLRLVSNRAEAFGDIAKVFLDYRVQDLFGIVLLHNHFSMKPGQKLVTLGNVATPWDANTASTYSTKVNSTSFRFIDGAITPYEFTYGTKELPLGEEMQHFLAALLPVLVKWSLDNLLGICALPDISGAVSTEFTSGNANITLPVDLNPKAGNIDAMWYFGRTADTDDSIPLGMSCSALILIYPTDMLCRLGTCCSSCLWLV